MADFRTSFAINGVTIKRPSDFKISRYRITEANRNAAGTMVMDNIARKRKFFFTYNAIESDELNTILNQIWETDSVFFTFSYKENNVSKSAVCYVGEIPSDLFRTDYKWTWKDVTMNFIER